MRDVAVIGGGMTLFRRRLKETGKELSFLATKMAMEEAGIEKSDIDMVVEFEKGRKNIHWGIPNKIEIESKRCRTDND